MIYILLSIVLSSLLIACFKFFEQYGIRSAIAIPFNYLSASLLGIIFGREIIFNLDYAHATWLPYTLIFGLFFIGIFNLIGIGVKKSGLMVVSIAQKMSLIIPLAFGIFFLKESLGILKSIGIILAFGAILLSTQKADKQKGIAASQWLLPLLIFIGSGLVDVFIKISQESFSKQVPFEILLAFIFGSAGIIGFTQMLFKPTKIHRKEILGGVILGIFNFCSTYVLMKALAMPGYESSFIFAINNIGIILFNTALSIFVFKEALQKNNKVGIVVAILAITVIYLSNVFSI